MAIESRSDIEAMSAAELETALGVPGATSSWDSFGPLMVLHRIGLYPTAAWGAGNGVANHPGWLASDTPGKPIIDRDPLIAGCRCILLKLRAHDRK